MTQGEINTGFIADDSGGKEKDIELTEVNLGIEEPSHYYDNASITTATTVPVATDDSGSSGQVKPKCQFSRRQWTYLAIFGVANLFRAIGILISPVFYPPEAKLRGLSDSQIGFILGSYDLATAVMVLIFGKFIIPRFGPRFIFKATIVNLGICVILFGCLDLINDKVAFLACSFAVRILNGALDAGFYPSAFTIFAEEFEGNVSTAIGLFELLFGVGSILGPLIFSSFFDYVGFLVVYVIVGVCLFMSAALCHFVLPRAKLRAEEDGIPVPVKPTPAEDHGEKLNIFKIFLIPSILLIFFSLFTTAVSIGFIAGTSRTHLEKFHLSTFQIGTISTVSNALYTFSTPLWGKISDILKNGRRHFLILVGMGFIFLGYSFYGPLPFAGKLSLWSTVLGMILHGLGIGGPIMSGFPYAEAAAISKGFPATEDTSSFISSAYILTFTLGNAVGPAVAGILVDNIGFQNGTLFVVILSLIVITATLAMSAFQRRCS